MPNHVFNEVRLHDVPMDKAMALIAMDGRITFAKLLPLPLHFWPGSVGAQHEAAFPGTHLSAARSTWGTKWDCYGGPEAVSDGADTVITFRTAWSPPRGWIVALFNTLNCRITSLWLDEGMVDGWQEIYLPHDPYSKATFDGPHWISSPIPEKSELHRRLHKALRGCEEFTEDDE